MRSSTEFSFPVAVVISTYATTSVSPWKVGKCLGSTYILPAVVDVHFSPRAETSLQDGAAGHSRWLVQQTVIYAERQLERPHMARFIVIEGIDGCGKSSVAGKIAESLGADSVLTREPTDSWIGEAVRKGEKGEVSPYLDALLFMADRAQHTLDIARNLAEGKTVVCDRYYHSTVAYQTAHLRLCSLGDNFNWLLDANLRISIRPDITLLLIVDPETAFKRIGGRGWTSRFEQFDFLRDVQNNYRRLARNDETMVEIDAEPPLPEVVKEALAAIERSKV